MKKIIQKETTTASLMSSIVVGSSILLSATAVIAHGSAGHSTKQQHAQQHAMAAPEQTDWGIAGDPKRVTRTIRIDMRDTMRFSPELITVKKNETIRFEVLNAGKVLHEMVIGTKKELDSHAEMMKKHPNMEHDEAYMAHVDPGKRGEIVWLFNREGEFDFACLIPGHYEAGMKGKIRVTL
jgi:uncharacterized cupredoxin-like copper-binding protein